jgi:hypothetical protein
VFGIAYEQLQNYSVKINSSRTFLQIMLRATQDQLYILFYEYLGNNCKNYSVRMRTSGTASQDINVSIITYQY